MVNDGVMDRLSNNVVNWSMHLSIVMTAIAVSIVGVWVVVVSVRVRSVRVLDNCALVVGLLKIKVAPVLGLKKSVVLIRILYFLTFSNFVLVCRLSALRNDLSGDKVLTVMELMSDIRLHLKDEMASVDERLRGAEGG